MAQSKMLHTRIFAHQTYVQAVLQISFKNFVIELKVSYIFFLLDTIPL